MKTEKSNQVPDIATAGGVAPPAVKGKIQKLVKHGGSRLVAVTTIVPTDWQYVEVVPLGKGGDNVVIALLRVK